MFISDMCAAKLVNYVTVSLNEMKVTMREFRWLESTYSIWHMASSVLQMIVCTVIRHLLICIVYFAWSMHLFL